MVSAGFEVFPSAKLRPMLSAECISIDYSSVNYYERRTILQLGDLVLTKWHNLGLGIVIMHGKISGLHWKHCSSQQRVSGTVKCIPWLKIKFASFDDGFENEHRSHITSWCFACTGYSESDWKSNFSLFNPQLTILCRSYPTALLLPHLLLDSCNLGLHGADLLAGMSVGSHRVGFSLAELSLHDAKLAVKDHQSNRRYDQSGPSYNQRMLLGFFKAIFFFFCGLATSRLGAEIITGIGGYSDCLRVEGWNPFLAALFVVGVGIVATAFFFWHGLLALSYNTIK